MNEHKKQQKQNKTPSLNHSCSVSEASTQLSVPENTIRKYLTYFDLPIRKVGRKTFITEESMNFIKEIIKLRANGLSLKKITALREEQSNKESLSTPPAQENHNEEAQEVNTNTNINTKTQANKNTAPPPQTKPKTANKSSGQPKIKMSSSLDLENELLSLSASKEQPTPGTQQETKSPGSEEKNQHQKASPEKDNLIHINEVSREIANQARRVTRLQRMLSSNKTSPKELMEIKADLGRRYIFLAGLRHIRDNWLMRGNEDNQQQKQISTSIISV